VVARRHTGRQGELYRWLKLEWPTDEALAEGATIRPAPATSRSTLTSTLSRSQPERLVTRIVKGFPRGSWEKEPSRRNEALDCRVYARAAAAICGIDRWPEARWRELERYLGREELPAPAPPEPPPETDAITDTPLDPAPGLAPRPACGLAQPRQAPVVVGSLSSRLREIAYDPWNATHIAMRLQDGGATMVEFRRGFRSMAAPTRELEKLIGSQRLAHGANPVTRWMAANVAVAQDPAGNLKPAKDKSTERIDGIVALIMAIGRAMVAK
jgi:Phage Terminase/Phage terminase large subunit (GpA)